MNILVSAINFDAFIIRGLINASDHLPRLSNCKSSLTEVVAEIVEFTLPENPKFGY